MQNKAHWMLELLESATRLRVLAKLRRAGRVPGGKKFCNAWDWSLTLSTDLASILAMAVHCQHSLGQIVWTLVLLKCITHIYALIFVPESLKQRKLRHSESRVPQVPWLRGTEKGKRKKHAATIHVSVCVCVCLSACLCVFKTAVSLNMKIWEKFWLKLKVTVSNGFPIVYLSCASMAEVLHYLGISHSFFVFLCITRFSTLHLKWSWISFITSILRDCFCGCLGFQIPCNS